MTELERRGREALEKKEQEKNPDKKERELQKKKDQINIENMEFAAKNFKTDLAQNLWGLFVLVGGFFSIIMAWSQYLFIFYVTGIEIVIALVLWALGVKLKLLAQTVLTLFVIAMVLLSAHHAFTYVRGTDYKKEYESMAVENSRMSKEIDKMIKESEKASVKASEKESFQESINAYYTAEYPGSVTETPETQIQPEETLPVETPEANHSDMQYDNKTGEWNTVGESEAPAPEESVSNIPEGAKTTSDMIWTGEDLFWIDSNDYYGTVIDSHLTKVTIKLASGDVVTQDRSIIRKVPLYGFKPGS